MATLLPPLRSTFFDANGLPLVGGKLYSYQAGTTTPRAVFTDPDGLVPHTNPIILDGSGQAEIWLKPGSYKFVLTDADDSEQYTIDKVKPADGGGGGILDEDYAYEGYSARFNQAFSSTGLNDTFEKILNFSYLAPQVSFSASGSGTLREKGDAVTASTLSATVTKRSSNIGEVRFYLNPSTLLDTDSSPNPAGGTSNYSWTGSFSDNTTFRVEVDDVSAEAKPSVSGSASFSFVYPYYVGAGAPGLTASAVAALTKRIINSSNNRLETITAGAGNVFYFAYPASYGALTSILDVNNFETFGDWTLRTENITGLDGNAVSYRIYEFENPVTAGSYQYTFKR